MLKIFLASISGALVLLGCASTGQIDSNDLEPRPPAWVVNPEKDGYFSVVGAAPKQEWGGHQAQYRVAMMKARQELAQMVRVQVESTYEFSVQEQSGAVSSNSNIESSFRSNTEINLEDAIVIEEWTNPQTGELFLWLALPR